MIMIGKMIEKNQGGRKWKIIWIALTLQITWITSREYWSKYTFQYNQMTLNKLSTTAGSNFTKLLRQILYRILNT